MKRPLLLVLFALLPACALFQRPPRPIHASPQEAQGFVEFHPHPGACEVGGPPVLHFSATYAIDVKNGRILAVQR
jgi:hypothetical protein